MRWERLFADLEAHVDALALEDRDRLVDDLTDETWSALRWRDVVGGAVEIDVAGHGVVSGVATLVNEQVVCLEGAVADIFVNPSAILAVLTAERRADPLSVVDAALGWSRVWRSLRDSGDEVVVTRSDGTTMAGTVDQVGGDFAMIWSRRRRVLVTNEAVAVLSCRR